MQFSSNLSSNHMRSAAYSEPMCVTRVCLQAYSAPGEVPCQAALRTQGWALVALSVPGV